MISRLCALAEKIGRPVSIMEVCGTHTMAIYRHGVRSLLPEAIRLISGPGCPVCVTSSSDIDRMLWLADDQQRIIATFGDMIRVPGSGQSLQQARSTGSEVRAVYSPMDAVQLAQANPERQIIFLAVGFETTAPGIAAAVLEAERLQLENFTIATALKLVPPALAALLSSPKAAIDGLLCPGHVSVIIGSAAYEEAASHHGVPCVISGFEGTEILDGLIHLLEQIAEQRPRVENRYPVWVKPQGNPQALDLLSRAFETCDAEWRGIGVIPASGLRLRESHQRFDAFRRFAVPELASREPAGCRCGDVLQGAMDPSQCRLFGGVCTPESPVGPCMVSSEGACAAAFKYGAR